MYFGEESTRRLFFLDYTHSNDIVLTIIITRGILYEYPQCDSESVTIPENVKHWHGAQHTSWFQHLSIKEGASTEWLEPVSEAEYAKLK